MADGTMAEQDRKQLMALWTANAPRVFAYILTMEPNWANAEDILQETSLTAWEKFAEFQPDTNFRAWACSIAYFKVLEHLRQRRIISSADEGLLETLSKEAGQLAERMDPRLALLSHCMEALSPRDRHVLDLRYRPGGSAKLIAEALQCSLAGAYKSLERIHEALLGCIQRGLAREERA